VRTEDQAGTRKKRAATSQQRGKAGCARDRRMTERPWRNTGAVAIAPHPRADKRVADLGAEPAGHIADTFLAPRLRTVTGVDCLRPMIALLARWLTRAVALHARNAGAAPVEGHSDLVLPGATLLPPSPGRQRAMIDIRRPSRAVGRPPHPTGPATGTRRGRRKPHGRGWLAKGRDHRRRWVCRGEVDEAVRRRTTGSKFLRQPQPRMSA
jgi:hypothetical protein